MHDRTNAKTQIEKLVRFFEQNIHQLKSQSFNETQARQQLIDPFFDALGWDVTNRGMKPLYLQEVVPEGRVRTNITREVKEQEVLFEIKSGLAKAHREYASILDYIAEDNYKANSKEAIKKPDYRFRIKGQTKFFVEAKKPFVDLSKSMEAIFQVKRYGFSGRVPLSILTDFEEFRTFDCTHKPQFDKPKLGIIKELDLKYTQYVDKFDFLYDTFSRDSVEAGSLDTLTRKLLKKKTGDFALDKHFLEDLSQWREELARDIAKHPRNRRRLNDYTLNESVQRILDRIVFFRVCEDREIEVENTLLAILQMWQGRPGISLYSLLNDLFKQRRSLYNGLLFAPHECEELEIGNDVLLKILEGLNYPFSPYYFNEIGVEILGSIYEKFLGKTIHLTPKTVRVDEKPEVRKAGGVYYTPQYIVNYIVDNTVGKLIEGKSPKQVAKLKIIDIACGSGSFLLGAFQKLIDHHVRWYQEHPKDIQTVNGVSDVYKDGADNLHLSARKKRDILVNNMYGVDIDRQAVEVTQMSLYLKVLEGENAETLNPQMTLALKEVYLPPLTDNIKCGNSLIGTDFASQGSLFDNETRQKVNPFDWEMEFTEIMKNGGFDAVIGNPPYIRIQGFSPDQIEYLSKHFKTVKGNADVYVSFIERAFALLNPNGMFGMIVPNKFFKTDYGEGLRELLSKPKSLKQVVNFAHHQVFEATTYTCLLFFSKKGNTSFSYKEAEASQESLLNSPSKEVSSNELTKDSWLFLGVEANSLEKKLKNQTLRLLDLPAEMSRGSSSGLDEVFMIETQNAKIEKNILRKPLFATDFSRYSFSLAKKWEIIFPYYFVDGSYALYRENDLKKKYPKAYSYLKKHQLELKKRKQFSEWFGFSAPRNLELHDKAQIAIPLLADRGLFAWIPDEHSGTLCPMASGGFTISIGSESSLSPKFVLALLNSSLLFWRLKQISNVFRGGWITCTKQYFGELPIRSIDFNNANERKLHDDLVSLVAQMLDLHKQLNESSFESQKEPTERQIAATDKKIDELVYKLYGLTEEEIKIVEGR